LFRLHSQVREVSWCVLEQIVIRVIILKFLGSARGLDHSCVVGGTNINCFVIIVFELCNLLVQL